MSWPSRFFSPVTYPASKSYNRLSQSGGKVSSQSPGNSFCDRKDDPNYIAMVSSVHDVSKSVPLPFLGFNNKLPNADVLSDLVRKTHSGALQNVSYQGVNLFNIPRKFLRTTVNIYRIPDDIEDVAEICTKIQKTGKLPCIPAVTHIAAKSCTK